MLVYDLLFESPLGLLRTGATIAILFGATLDLDFSLDYCVWFLRVSLTAFFFSNDSSISTDFFIRIPFSLD
jgi:hypothetical protein